MLVEGIPRVHGEILYEALSSWEVRIGQSFWCCRLEWFADAALCVLSTFVPTVTPTNGLGLSMSADGPSPEAAKFWVETVTRLPFALVGDGSTRVLYCSHALGALSGWAPEHIRDTTAFVDSSPAGGEVRVTCANGRRVDCVLVIETIPLECTAKGDDIALWAFVELDKGAAHTSAELRRCFAPEEVVQHWKPVIRSLVQAVVVHGSAPRIRVTRDYAKLVGDAEGCHVAQATFQQAIETARQSPSRVTELRCHDNGLWIGVVVTLSLGDEGATPPRECSFIIPCDECSEFLGPFQLERGFLASGSQGVVRELASMGSALGTPAPSRLIAKVFHRRPRQADEAHPFWKEARALAEASRWGPPPPAAAGPPRLVAAIGGGPGLWALVTAKAPGRPLSWFLHQARHNSKPISTPQLRSLFGAVARGLCWLHAHGCAHRDIKADNIVWEPTPFGVTIVDFQTAVFQHQPMRRATSPCGTPLYAAPEVGLFRPEPLPGAGAGAGAGPGGEGDGGYDPMAADMWSLGGLLTILLAAGTAAHDAWAERMVAVPTADDGFNGMAHAAEVACDAVAAAHPAADAEGGLTLARRLLHPIPESRPDAHAVCEHPFVSEEGTSVPQAAWPLQPPARATKSPVEPFFRYGSLAWLRRGALASQGPRLGAL